MPSIVRIMIFVVFFDSIIPSFFNQLSEKRIRVVTHPVLINETQKHIIRGLDNKLPYKDRVANLINALKRNKGIISLSSIDYDKMIAELNSMDLESKCIIAFKDLIKDAEILSYCNPDIVFEKYFRAEPPFADKGNKKSEFPDAFAIESIMDYIKTHNSDYFLIVSNDSDWTKSFENIDRVTMADSLNQALALLNDRKDLGQFIDKLDDEIKTKLIEIIPDFWIQINNYDLWSEVQIENILINDLTDTVFPLSISDSEIVLQTNAEILLDGAATIRDYDNAIWDQETRTYLDFSLAELVFEGASSNVNIEIHIKIKDDSNLELVEVRIIDKAGIWLTLEEGNYQIEEHVSKSDARAEMYDVLEEYYNHKRNTEVEHG